MNSPRVRSTFLVVGFGHEAVAGTKFGSQEESWGGLIPPQFPGSICSVVEAHQALSGGILSIPSPEPGFGGCSRG